MWYDSVAGPRMAISDMTHQWHPLFRLEGRVGGTHWLRAALHKVRIIRKFKKNHCGRRYISATGRQG